MTDAPQDLARIARCSARRKIGFFIHASVFLLVNLFLIALQRETTPAFNWAIFPAAGWALGLSIHSYAWVHRPSWKSSPRPTARSEMNRSIARLRSRSSSGCGHHPVRWREGSVATPGPSLL